ncbi:MAG: hypothetical protein M3Q07_08075 [Pseudobdellovibrionaceae bacterium]|nr:hypothetical protein [Pseudobdellovibrionaceae bacterium]
MMARKNREAPAHPIVRTALFIAGLTSQRVRARDVLFSIDLVKNIFEASIHCPEFELQSVQILRLFKKYDEHGWGRMTTEGSAVILHLNGEGLFQILHSLVQVDHIMPLNESIFLQWFLDSYQTHIRARIKPELSPDKQVQLETYLKPHALFDAQLKRLDMGMIDMQRRIDDSRRLVLFVDKARSQGLRPEEIVQTLPSEFSYRMTHQKRFRTWLQELPGDILPFEMEQGIAYRQKHLYQRLLNSMQMTRGFYEDCKHETQPFFNAPSLHQMQHASPMIQD